MLIDQQAHEFGHGDRRMRVVELRGELLVEALDRNLLHLEDAEHVLQRARDEEVLLRQAQLLALQLLVVRIQHLAEIFRRDLLHHCAVVVAAIEDGEVERFRRLGLPQSQRIRGVLAIAEDRRVVGNARHQPVRHPANAQAVEFVVVLLGVTAQLHVYGPLGSRDFPGIAEAQPLVGALGLPAVDDFLMEDAEFVADAVAKRRNLQRRQRFDEAGGQPSQTAIAESRFIFFEQQLVEVQSQFGDGLADLIVDAEIHEIVAEMRPHQKLGREVRDCARALLRVSRRGTDPALQHAIAHRIGKRLVVVVPGRQRRKLALDVEQVVEEGVLERLLCQCSAVIFACGLFFYCDERRSHLWHREGCGQRYLPRCKFRACDEWQEKTDESRVYAPSLDRNARGGAV